MLIEANFVKVVPSQDMQVSWYPMLLEAAGLQVDVPGCASRSPENPEPTLGGGAADVNVGTPDLTHSELAAEDVQG